MIIGDFKGFSRVIWDYVKVIVYRISRELGFSLMGGRYLEVLQRKFELSIGLVGNAISYLGEK